MKFRKSSMTAAIGQALAIGIALGATGASAQDAQKVEKIEVTGSNIKRIDGETALPVTVIKREDIEKTGMTSAAQLLDKLQLNSGAVVNLSQGVGDSAAPGFSGASLRGLGPNNTLILLNGRRVANYAFNGAAVDVNSIPLAAVERVEVLRDGASAVYGTDAIGGVVNFILKSDFNGVELQAYGTDVDRGGGKTTKYTATAGYGKLSQQKFNFIATFDKEESDPIAAKQRSFAATAIRPDLGIQQTSGNIIPAAIRFDANGSLGNANILAASGCKPEIGSYYLPAVSTRQCRYDFTSRLEIFPPVDRQSAVVKATFAPMENWQVFGEYVWVKSKARFASSETPVNDFVGNGPFIYPAGGKYYPAPFRLPNGTLITPTGDLGIAWRAQDGGRRTDIASSKADRIVIGAKGSVGGWDIDAGFNRAESKVTDTYVDGWFFESKLKAAIRTGNINIFSTTGQDTQGQQLLQGAKILEDVRRSKGTVDAFDMKGSTELWRMDGGNVGLAVGAETRNEKFDDNPLPVLASGDVLGGGGNLPVTKASRRVSAVFAEMNFPLAKDFEAGLALRTDRYSDFGNSTNPKVSMRWTPSKQLLVRGSYNTGFRAPSLPDLFQPRFFSNTADTHNDPIRCPGGNPIGAFVDDGLECEAQIQNQLGGNRSLQPEKSRQMSVGVLMEPTQALSIGLDYFRILRKNSLQALSDTTVFDFYGVQDPLNAQGRFVRYARLANGRCANDTSTPTPANVPCAIQYAVQVQENVGEYLVSGIDFSLGYNQSWGSLGKMRYTMDGTFIQKYQYQFAKNGPIASNVGRHTADNGAVSRYRWTLAANWSKGDWSANVAQNFVAGYRDAGGARNVGNVETYDVQAQWKAFKGLTLVAGVRNVFDRDPPASAQGQSFQVGYDPRYGDPFGRVFYAKVNYLFK
ncbi:MAG TPA: TonB-dependent receptor [Usitatibacteraceae bacterium]|nr:TonB-dependent receptor [Usitatibacteraceae bacterium]